MRMLRIILPALTVLAALVPASGHADPYRWCAEYSGRAGGASNCGFVTLQQCQATVSGIGGFCVRNQFYTGPEHSTTGSGRHSRRNPKRYKR